jgi:hypothetical protein
MASEKLAQWQSKKREEKRQQLINRALTLGLNASTYYPKYGREHWQFPRLDDCGREYWQFPRPDNWGMYRGYVSLYDAAVDYIRVYYPAHAEELIGDIIT